MNDLPSDPATVRALVDHLLPFVSAERRQRMFEVLQYRTDHLRVVLEDIYQPHNASAAMRSCECFGVQHLHVIENRYAYTLNREVAMGAFKWINLHRHNLPDQPNTRLCINNLKQLGYRIVATSLRPGTIPIGQLPLDQPVALCFGTEEDGLTTDLLDQADDHIRIPMYGFTQSFNLSVTVSLALQELRNRLHLQGGCPPLSENQQQAVLLQWLCNSIRQSDTVVRSFLRQRLQGPRRPAPTA